VNEVDELYSKFIESPEFKELSDYYEGRKLIKSVIRFMLKELRRETKGE